MEKAFLGNEINALYKNKGRSLHSKDSKQTPKYLKPVDKHLVKNNIYTCIISQMKSKTSHHEEVKVINLKITQATQCWEQQCEK